MNQVLGNFRLVGVNRRSVRRQCPTQEVIALPGKAVLGKGKGFVGGAGHGGHFAGHILAIGVEGHGVRCLRQAEAEIQGVGPAVSVAQGHGQGHFPDILGFFAVQG